MKKLILLFLVLHIFCALNYGQNEDKVHTIVYGDKNYMEKGENDNIWRLKEGVEDGLWEITFAKDIENNVAVERDYAVVARVIDGVYYEIYNVWSSDDKYYLITYGNEEYMKKCSYGWELKKNVEDGVWYIFYSEEFKDIAIICNIKNGLLDGIYKRWDEDNNYLRIINQYKEGKLNGLAVDFFKIEGKSYTNVYIYLENILDQTIQIEF